jgi:hypothetical protein
MKKVFRKILIVCLVGMLLLSGSQAAFAKFVLENASSSHLSFNKEKYSSTFIFFENAIAEELEEEKNDDDTSDESRNTQRFLGSQPSLFKTNLAQLDFDFLKIKSLLFRQLYLTFHCLKIHSI